MGRRVEELLNTLHSLQFSDAETVLNELRSLVLSNRLSPAQIAFCSTKLLNSEISLLELIKKFKQEQDRLIWKTVTNALVLVSEYITYRSFAVAKYMQDIKDTCMSLMATSTKSSMVKEAALKPLIKLIEVFKPAQIQDVLNPTELVKILLDGKIKLEEKKLGSTCKRIYSKRRDLSYSGTACELFP